MHGLGRSQWLSIDHGVAFSDRVERAPLLLESCQFRLRVFQVLADFQYTSLLSSNGVNEVIGICGGPNKRSVLGCRGKGWGIRVDRGWT